MSLKLGKGSGISENQSLEEVNLLIATHTVFPVLLGTGAAAHLFSERIGSSFCLAWMTTNHIIAVSILIPPKHYSRTTRESSTLVLSFKQ